MRRMRLCVFALLFVGLPCVAHAQSDFWDFIESFSGPGPFQGMTVSARLLCIDQNKATYWGCFNDTKESIRWVLNVDSSVPYLTSDDNARFKDTPNDKRTVHVYKFGATMFYRFHAMVDLGAGVGAYVFGGDDVNRFSRLTATPINLVFTPLGWMHRSPTATKWGRVVRVSFAETYVTQGINPSNFMSASSYTKGGEFVNNVTVGLDIGPFIPWPK